MNFDCLSLNGNDYLLSMRPAFNKILNIYYAIISAVLKMTQLCENDLTRVVIVHQLF